MEKNSPLSISRVFPCFLNFFLFSFSRLNVILISSFHSDLLPELSLFLISYLSFCRLRWFLHFLIEFPFVFCLLIKYISFAVSRLSLCFWLDTFFRTFILQLMTDFILSCVRFISLSISCFFTFISFDTAFNSVPYACRIFLFPRMMIISRVSF